MDFAQDSKASSRTTAFIIVIVLHVLMIWALASGLAKKIVKAVADPIETKVIETPPPPPPPPEKIVPPPPDLKAPPPPFVPVPEIAVQTPPPPAAIQSPTSSDPPPTNNIKPSPPPAPVAAPPAPKPAGPVQVGVACKTNPPEITTELSQPMEVKFTITLRGGKVVAKEAQVIRGLPDRRAQRQIVQTLSNTIDTYACGTYEGVVEQIFAVNPPN